MTAESLNEQQLMLVDKLIASHEAEIKYEKHLSWTNGAYTSAVFITLALIVAHGIGLINLIGGCAK